MRYLPRLVERVEEKFSRQFPAQFALVFDECSVGCTHYLAIFVSHSMSNAAGYGV